MEVTGLAATHKVKSDGFVAADQALVSTGTITLQSGDADPIEIEVSAAAGNDTLSAVRDAINAADAGVAASIVFDGSQFRLTVRAEASGTANALTMTDDTNLNLDLAGNEISEAADATLVVEGLPITSSSNKVTGVIPGVTLDLLTETTGQPITVEVAQDTDGVVESVQTLVEKYNELNEFFGEHDNRERPGVLAGDPTARSIQSQLRNLITAGLPGIPFGGIRALSSIGVSFDGRSGDATLDTSKLRDLLATDFKAIGDLFLSSGRASHPRVQYAGATSSTVDGTYAIEVTQAAEQATLTGSSVITQLAQDETLTIGVGGESVDVALTAGQTLADVVDAVNAALRGAGLAATASDNAGRLRLTTRDFGSAVELSVASSLSDPADGSQSGFDVAAAADSGLDVAGSIGGIAGNGNGQALSAADEGDVSGLVVRITASAAEVASSSSFGTLSYSRGLIDTLRGRIDRFVEFDSGLLDVARNGLEDNISRLTRDIERIQDRLISREARLVQTFSAAERAISALQSQQSQLG